MSEQPSENSRGLIAWFTRNPVAANLLMIFIILGGLLSTFSIKKQAFPPFVINAIRIDIEYPGAAPQEVEEGIAIKVEKSLEGIQGLQRVITYSRRDSFQAYIRVENAYDVQAVLDEVKNQVDAISSLPERAERPVVKVDRYRQEVLYISLYGDLPLAQLKRLGREIHREIQEIPAVDVSEYYSGPDFEVTIEVSRDKLREYAISFQDIATAIREFSTNQSAGQIKAADGTINLRVQNQAYTARDFESIPLLNLDDGSRIYLSQVATVKDGFTDGGQLTRFNGQNAVTYFIGATDSQSITDVSAAVGRYVDSKNTSLPHNVHLESWVDFTTYLQGRLNMMLENMFYGALLVFIVIGIFLHFRLAFWVMLGLPVAFLGALFLMPMSWIDVSINITSLFAFIMVLGIVVDDAVVIGESVNTAIEQHGHSADSVVRGVKRVALPATFGVLTTIAAFSPLVASSGPEAPIAHSIGYVVVLCLAFSLVESKLILPAHLAAMKSPPPSTQPNAAMRLRRAVNRGLQCLIQDCYRPLLRAAITYRYCVITFSVALIFVSIGLFQGGVIRYVGVPKVPHDFPSIEIEMHSTASQQATLAAVGQVEQVLNKVDAAIQAQYGLSMIAGRQVELQSRTHAVVKVKLIEPERRPINTFELANRWREAMPLMPNRKSLTIKDNLFAPGLEDGDISFRLNGDNYDALILAAGDLRRELSSIDGIVDINDSRMLPTREVRFSLRPVAYAMGLTLEDIASQLNFGYYGLEAQRLMRDGEEIKVMVRYPERQRNGFGTLEEALIQTGTGQEIALSEVAEFTLIPGADQIRRENGRKNISVWATIDPARVEPRAVHDRINRVFLPALARHYPDIVYEPGGSFTESEQSQQTNLRNMLIALMVIFVLLAVPLRSYLQPLVIMSVIPFGVIGAMLGHLILGMDMNAFSLFGIVAAAGVVINDSLVIVDHINRARRRGLPVVEAVVQSGCQRFRAVLLTSLTTFIGLIPIIAETSLQARTVIPMAVSLAFGVLFATFITLLFIPCLYVAGSGLSAGLMRFLMGGRTATAETGAEVFSRLGAG
ncbi:efflux RND transporter permease subunit [Exilibacterium tricleocarpae]|uniref:Efflux RND transporter permease subunit n=1 Tax=Exilibacterium tricleocarpae TaxID=2591008 RepID=A0A545TS98_9GAMM|nr:efflux RND transporter permease subunit [Exilibacterium tricleocarpae]TQV80094.1 efflux RND transporter permease subunit [Exilibacterium tricleocarpae]